MVAAVRKNRAERSSRDTETTGDSEDGRYWPVKKDGRLGERNDKLKIRDTGFYSTTRGATRRAHTPSLLLSSLPRRSWLRGVRVSAIAEIKGGRACVSGEAQ